MHAVHAPMMALVSPDPVLNFPAGTVLNPQLFLRNTAAWPLELSGTLNWRSPSNTGTFTMPLLTLAPGELRVLRLSDYIQSGQIPSDANWSTVKFTYTGRSGDLVPIASSYDSSAKYGLQTPFSEGMAAHWAGSMWHVDSTRNTLISATNGGDKPTHTAVNVYYGAGKQEYQILKQLNPGEQLWIDLGQIIRGQIADSKGSVIPPGTTMGTYELLDLDHAAGTIYEGKLILDSAYGRGYYGCATCCGDDKIQGVTWSPTPYTNTVGNGTWNTLWAYDMCYSGWDDVTPSGSGWGSTNTGVATVASEYTSLVGAGGASGFTNSIYLPTNNPKTNCANAPFTVQSQSINSVIIDVNGNAFIPLRQSPSTGPNSATYTASANPAVSGATWSWSIDAGADKVSLTQNANSATLTAMAKSSSQRDITLTATYTLPDGTKLPKSVTPTVVQPTSLTIPTTTNGTILCDPLGSFSKCVEDTFSGQGSYNAPMLQATYSIIDQFGNQSFGGLGLQIQESYTTPTGTCSGLPVNTSSGVGDHVSDCYYICSETCRTGGSCSSSATQTITINGFQVATKSVTWTGQGVTLQ